jgi:hypothetical protein
MLFQFYCQCQHTNSPDFPPARWSSWHPGWSLKAAGVRWPTPTAATPPNIDTPKAPPLTWPLCRHAAPPPLPECQQPLWLPLGACQTCGRGCDSCLLRPSTAALYTPVCTDAARAHSWPVRQPSAAADAAAAACRAPQHRGTPADRPSPFRAWRLLPCLLLCCTVQHSSTACPSGPLLLAPLALRWRRVLPGLLLDRPLVLSQLLREQDECVRLRWALRVGRVQQLLWAGAAMRRWEGRESQEGARRRGAGALQEPSPGQHQRCWLRAPCAAVALCAPGCRRGSA